ncbi:ABC transporter ATP-binding protein [Haloferula chungangensis]|uniref:ABC transporter ATP-binding protein n=1 Tax=Haloferula chungangensis TaxID=1048331 RepID=A0ABW2L6F6_9BACT
MSKESGKKGKVSGSMKWLFGYLRPYRAIFIPSLLALFVTAALSLVFPLILKDLIGDPADAWKNGVDAQTVKDGLDQNMKWLVGALCLQAFIAFWRVLGFMKSGEAALNDLRRDLFAHMLRLPVSFFQDQRSGALSTRVAGDLGVVRETLMNTVPQMVRQLVILVGGLTAVFFFSWKLALVMLGSIPVVVLAVAVFGRKVRARSKEAQDALADSGTVIEESVQSITDVKAFGNEAFEEHRYSSALDRFFAVTMKGALARAFFLSFIIFVMFGTIAFVTWYGAGMLVREELSQRDFVAFILFSIFVGASLGSFPEIISQLQAMSGASERIREILQDETEASGGEKITGLTGALAFEDVAFRYSSRPEQAVIDGLNLEVEPGQRVALVGPSGAGKSTIFSLILGFHRPGAGKVTFDGRDATTLDLASLRSQIAVVPQEVLLFGGTILENIEYGRPGATKEEIEAAAKEANAHDFIMSLPEGYATMVGPRGVKISGGQRQRIAIARAILSDARILLLDEATSALDTESERLVNEALERLMKGRTSLVIAHRLSTVRHADRILVINHGKLVESGTHDQLVAMRGTYRLLAETQLA